MGLLVEQKKIHSPYSFKNEPIVVGGYVAIAVVSAFLAGTAMTARTTTLMTTRDATNRAATEMATRSTSLISARAIIARAAIAMTIRAAMARAMLLFLMVNCLFRASVIPSLQLPLFTLAGMFRGVVHVEVLKV
jgi:hypothetical protein